jgi:putative membrane-bound dehydrogenase-like protein
MRQVAPRECVFASLVLFATISWSTADRAFAQTDGPLTPAEAAARFQVADDFEFELVLAEPEVKQPVFLNFDERGRMWVVQYLQYPDPAGLKLVSKDKWWRAVYDKVPVAPPNHVRGADKITIHEDTDGDGRFDTQKTFVDGLNIVTACAKGRGGVWILNPPYLLFYPDADDNDVPDGDPIVHLEGFGLEDTHSVVNSLRWGPDGWLYAAQGSTVSGHVKRPGEKQIVHSLGQLIWRYHPETRRYEIFSEGGGNAFGVEIDSQGRIFSGHNGGNTRGFHYDQGAYLQKGFAKHGPLSNPYAFGYFPPMAHHNVPRFTHTFVIYEGGAFPAAHTGRLFGVAPLLSHVVESEITPEGSTWRTKDIGHPVTTKDAWFRPVDIKDGPDGALYVADWYDRQVTHTRNQEGQIDKSNGRIYRLKAKGAEPSKPHDLSRMDTAALIETLQHPNRWHRQTALRVLADRHDSQAIPVLKQLVFENTGQTALEALWALNLVSAGGAKRPAAANPEPREGEIVQSLGAGRTCWLDEPTVLKLLDHADPYVRFWTARLVGDDRETSAPIAQKLAQQALGETNVEVRSQLASTARRLPAEQSLPILAHLATHDEDATDPRLPLLIWWGLETACETHPDAVVKLFEDSTIWNRKLVLADILHRLMQRFAATGHRKDLLVCARLLKLAPGKEAQNRLMAGFEEAFRGRPLANLPDELALALSQTGGVSELLALRQGQPEAVQKALQLIADDKADIRRRAQFVQIFGEINQPQSVPVLLALVRDARDDALRMGALAALQQYDSPSIGTDVLQAYERLSEDARSVALSLLTSRKAWAVELLAAVDAGRIERAAIPLDLVRRMTIFRDDRLAKLIEKHFGAVEGSTTEEMRQQIDRYAAIIRNGPGDPYQGKKLFTAQCAKCHTLFALGGRIGPDLTPYRRDDLDTLLLHVVNPSAEIREGFETLLVLTEDGRTATGFLVDRDSQVVVLRGADGQNVTIPQSRIEETLPQRRSLMPENLLKEYTDQQLRDLFAYLRSSQPLND